MIFTDSTGSTGTTFPASIAPVSVNRYNSFMDKIIQGNPEFRAEGEISIPASKSHSIRALLIASLAQGESRLESLLESQDSLSCAEAVRLLGAKIQRDGDLWKVTGRAGHFSAPSSPIDVGNSGTTLYLATALAALSGEKISFTGDEQIRNRSAGNLLEALKDFGVFVESSTSPQGVEGCAPYTVQGPLRGGRTSMECPTSQYLSALLLAAPLIKGGESIKIDVPLLYERPYVDLTLDWLDRQGIEYTRRGYQYFEVPGGQAYKAFDRRIPGDFSSATFFFCLAALSGGTLKIRGLDPQDPQGDKHILDLLEKMGCSIKWEGEILSIKGNPLKGAELDLNATPDALPALAVTALFAQGKTRLTNVPQARMKETDRIDCMTRELRKLGAEVLEEEDGMIITGGLPLKGCTLEGWGDHRIVMALALAGLKIDGKTTIRGADAAAVTFPEFFDILETLQ